MKYISKQAKKGYLPEGKDTVGDLHTTKAKNIGRRAFDVVPVQDGFVVTNKLTNQNLGTFKVVDYDATKNSFIAKTPEKTLVCEIATGRVFETHNSTTFGVIILDDGKMFKFKNNGSVGENPMEQTAYLDENGKALFSGGNMFTRGTDGELNLFEPSTENIFMNRISDDPNAKVSKIEVKGQDVDFFMIEDKDEKAVFIPPQTKGEDESVCEIFKVGAGQEISVNVVSKGDFNIVCYDPSVDATKIMLNKFGQTKVVEIGGKLVKIYDDGNGNIRILSTGEMGKPVELNVLIEPPVQEVVEETTEIVEEKEEREGRGSDMYSEEDLDIAKLAIEEEQRRIEAERVLAEQREREMLERQRRQMQMGRDQKQM